MGIKIILRYWDRSIAPSTEVYKLLPIVARLKKVSSDDWNVISHFSNNSMISIKRYLSLGIS